MVMNLRWTDSSVDLTMRSEAESLNVPGMLRPLKFWKNGADSAAPPEQ